MNRHREAGRQTDAKHSTCVWAIESMVNLSMDAWLKEAINEGVVHDVAVLGDIQILLCHITYLCIWALCVCVGG
jgi:hypothetical protein